MREGNVLYRILGSHHNTKNLLTPFNFLRNLVRRLYPLSCRHTTQCVAWNILRYANRSRTFDSSVICITHNIMKVRKIHNRSRISRMKWNGIVFTQVPTSFSRALYSIRKETNMHIYNAIRHENQTRYLDRFPKKRFSSWWERALYARLSTILLFFPRIYISRHHLQMHDCSTSKASRWGYTVWLHEHVFRGKLQNRSWSREKIFHLCLPIHKQVRKYTLIIDLFTWNYLEMPS